jgi:hypothetical protein
MITYPKTKAEAQAYRYGKYAGCPKGHAYVPERCAVEISQAVGWSWVQCSRKAGHGPEKMFCVQHAKKLEGRS